MKKGLLILIAAIVVIVVWAFSGYNGMVEKQESATTALSNVEASYQRRADLIPQLAKTVKAYAKHEKETFEEVTKARNMASQIHLDANDLTPEKMQQYEAAQNQLANAFSKLIAVAEAYPELKASENFKSLQVQLEGTENRINEARRKYNESVQTYNVAIRRMPNALIAGVFGFDKMTKFEAANGAEKAPDLGDVFDN
jgi:LemA protein